MSNNSNDLKPYIGRIASGDTLNTEDARNAFDIMMSGNATNSQMGAFLMGMRVRGETVEEITGGASIMRDKALTVAAPNGTIDTCGTGGDSSGTYNISTAASLIAAGCGVPVAKHGNRALSSRCGSADVLLALGVKIDTAVELVERCIQKAGIGFLMAPRHHGAMRHVASTRVELGTRTIFNLLGPLSSPADAKRQLIGVYSPQWLVPMAEVLRNLGSTHVWVAHGSDGLDEITTTGTTQIAELKNGNVRTFELTNEDFGLPKSDIKDLKGSDADENARAITEMLSGLKSPFRDIALANAGAALVVAGKVNCPKKGVELAARAIDDGSARRALEKLIEISNETSAAEVCENE